MKKINKLINGIRALLKRPSLINLIIDSSEFHENKLKNKFRETAKELPVIGFQNLCTEGKIQVSPFAFLEGGSLPTDLALLKILAQKNKDSVYFEIGTWRGESVANVASVAKECYTLNLSSEEMQTLGLSKKYIDLHEHYSKKIKNVQHLKGHSFTFDFSPFKNKIDLVFVDGDHHYESVLKDTATAFSLLKNNQSIIVWHDYSAGPEMIRWEVFRGIYEATPAEKRKHLYKVSNTQCAIYYPFDIENKYVEYPQTPELDFVVDIAFTKSL